MPVMKQNSSAYIFRRSIYLFFSIFMLTGAVISGLMMIFYRSEIKTRLSQLKTYEEFSVNLQSKAIENLFDSIAGDLFFLSRQNELQEYLLKGDPSYLDEIASEYINLCAQKKIYDQIRFLDTNGMEMVRINYNQGKPARIASDKLQSKQKRYYFKDCYQLDQGEVFISPFDLNIEHDRIEQPLKPMIRLGTPVFDSNGLKRGIVLLNYLGSDLLNRLIESEQVSTAGPCCSMQTATGCSALIPVRNGASCSKAKTVLFPTCIRIFGAKSRTGRMGRFLHRSAYLLTGLSIHLRKGIPRAAVTKMPSEQVRQKSIAGSITGILFLLLPKKFSIILPWI